MKITAVKTKIVEASACALTEFLREGLRDILPNSIVAITSKVVALCEGHVVPVDQADKEELIEREADFFLPRNSSKYGVYLAIKNHMLVPSAGIDESNTNGYYVLWPKNPQASANSCWQFLRDRFALGNVGVIITDSTTAPLRWGVTGRSIAYCGFKGLNSKIGETDLFGRSLRMTKVNVAEGLAAAAALCMGEADEQTPLAIIEDVPFVEFQQHVPTIRELADLRIDLEDDLYAPLLSEADWQSRKK